MDRREIYFVSDGENYSVVGYVIADHHAAIELADMVNADGTAFGETRTIPHHDIRIMQQLAKV